MLIYKLPHNNNDTNLAAMPSDVRKVSDFPGGVLSIWGYAPTATP